MQTDLKSSTSPLATYTFTDSSIERDLPMFVTRAIGARGGRKHNQAKNRAARRARRINRLNRNGQHL